MLVFTYKTYTVSTQKTKSEQSSPLKDEHLLLGSNMFQNSGRCDWGFRWRPKPQKTVPYFLPNSL
jgi:hypothetical protein